MGEIASVFWAALLLHAATAAVPAPDAPRSEQQERAQPAAPAEGGKRESAEGAQGASRDTGSEARVTELAARDDRDTEPGKGASGDGRGQPSDDVERK